MRLCAVASPGGYAISSAWTDWSAALVFALTGEGHDQVVSTYS
jgi:hypothetical protein